MKEMFCDTGDGVRIRIAREDDGDVSMLINEQVGEEIYLSREQAMIISLTLWNAANKPRDE